MAKRKRKKADINHRTLCTTCIFAYGDECFSTPPDERTWAREVELAGRDSVRAVKKCDRHKRGRKPLPGRRAVT